METNGKTAAVGMSGGVDSTVTAWLLKRQGYRVIGVTMLIGDDRMGSTLRLRIGCAAGSNEERLEKVRRWSERLGIPHIAVPLAGEFQARVLDYFRDEYSAGRTPNPCVICNRAIKFGVLLDKAAEQAPFDVFATGHYARIAFDAATGRYQLLKGSHTVKDQSYFLCGLSQAQLARTLFPLGEMTKTDVRALAREAGFPELAEGGESQDFMDSREFGEAFGPDLLKPGPILDLEGRELGRHPGIMRYTIGQRKGLGLHGGTGDPLYVIRLDAERRAVIVGPREALFRKSLLAKDMNWISMAPPAGAFRTEARIRQQHKPAPATAVPEPGDSSRMTVTFDEPQPAITPGQAVALYDGERVVAGGTIED